MAPANQIHVIHPDGSTRIFQSLGQAERELGMKRSTIHKYAESGEANKKGMRFKVLEVVNEDITNDPQVAVMKALLPGVKLVNPVFKPKVYTRPAPFYVNRPP